MLFNYIKIAFRSLSRKMVYTTINVLGLSAGLVCVVFIFNWVKYELSYDQHFPKKEEIYRIVAEASVGADQWHQAVTSLPIAPAMKDDFPEVRAAVRLDKNDALVKKGDRQYIEDFIVFTDPAFLEVFDYKLLLGDDSTALSDPYKIVLTESLAEKYFGEENPLGQLLKIYAYDTTGNGADYEVTGVIADPADNSHFTFNMLGSISTIESAYKGAMQNWGNNSYHSYILLEQDVDVKELEKKFPAFADQYLGTNNSYRFYLQPLASIHLNSNLLYEFKANGKKEFIWIFSAIGVFILFLATVNYINLSTSFSMERAKETGVRKVLGAFRSQLIYQHLIEALVLTFFSFILAGILVEILKPLFYQISGKNHIPLGHWDLILQLLVICVPLALITGYFPARMLSGMHTIRSLKGRIVSSSYGGLRNILVVSQFAVTLIILVGLVVITQQMDFVLSKDLGYNKDNLLVLRVNGSEEVYKGYEGFKNELLSSTGISSIAVSGSMIANGLGNGTGRASHDNGENQYVKLYRLPVGHGYINTYGMNLLAGRDFDPALSSDSTESFIINEKAAAAYGWSPDEAIGKILSFDNRKGPIIGVTADFHFNSLKYEIQPLCMYIGYYSRITVKGDDPEKLLGQVENTWVKHFPTAMLDYVFQDEAILYSYQEEKRFSNIINVFSILSVIIAFLGLFGLVSYTVRRKTKEISIRKVLGASVREIITMISGKFLRLIFIASIIAFPIAWWIMAQWLNNFPYHSEISIWIFFGVGAVILMLSLALISAQTIKTALVNPADTLNED
ncbi:MAG: ABC transporter permease [Candidatus Cyclobacteriaceae bacterium M2_1C_046]